MHNSYLFTFMSFDNYTHPCKHHYQKVPSCPFSASPLPQALSDFCQLRYAFDDTFARLNSRKLSYLYLYQQCMKLLILHILGIMWVCMCCNVSQKTDIVIFASLYFALFCISLFTGKVNFLNMLTSHLYFIIVLVMVNCIV